MDTKRLQRTGCITLLGVAVAAFAYSLGWQRGEVAGQERAIMRNDAIAIMARAPIADQDSDDAAAAPVHPAAAGASNDRP
jgi:hypothetical protein